MKNTFKKLIALLLLTTMVLGLVSCVQPEDVEYEGNDPTLVEPEPKKEVTSVAIKYNNKTESDGYISVDLSAGTIDLTATVRVKNKCEYTLTFESSNEGVAEITNDGKVTLKSKEGIVLSVDNYVPTAYTAHYNRKEQGLFADYVIIMGYDEYYAGSPEAGPVSSIEYVENGIADTVEVVPANKVINAVPFYTRVWKTTNGTLDSEAVSMDVATQFIANNGIETYWNETTCHNYGEAQIGDVFYQVWLEDTQALQDKLNVMKKYNLGGVAEWKLGLENAAAWDLIANYMNE